VDDVVVHCKTEHQAHMLVTAIGERMEQVGLRLHPTKTKIVYCKDGVAIQQGAAAGGSQAPVVNSWVRAS
jgi:hypothetical protein